MVNKKELFTISLVILLFSFLLNLFEKWAGFWKTLLMVSIIIGTNILIKKITAYYLDSKIEIDLWNVRQFGFKTNSHLKKPFQTGVVFPIISKILFAPFNSFIWMASLVFDAKPKVYKTAKRHGLYSFSEVTENQMGLIAAAGVGTNLILVVTGYLLGFHTFAQLGIYYVFFNMLPISELDGNKIFFGNLVLWSFLASITLLGILLSIFII
jgi:Zn-dependent protease